MMNEEMKKPKRGRPVGLPKAPDPIFEPEYIATKKDLEKMATKMDLAQLKGELIWEIQDVKGDVALLKKDIETILGLGKLLLIIVTIGFAALGLLIKL